MLMGIEAELHTWKKKTLIIEKGQALNMQDIRERKLTEICLHKNHLNLSKKYSASENQDYPAKDLQVHFTVSHSH